MTTLLSAAQRADLHAVLRAWYQTQPPATTLAEAETFAVAVGQAAAECVFEQGTQACGTRAGYQGPRLPCPCGQQARFVSYRQRWLRGRPGLVGVSRAYYHCRHCHTAQVPWDRTEGLDAQEFTPHCKAWLTELCARASSYRDAQRLLTRHHGFEVEVSSLEVVTGTVGGRLRAAENAQVAALFEHEEWPPADPALAAAVGRRFYVCVDAAKAHTGGAWHDIKVAACFVGEPPPHPLRARKGRKERALLGDRAGRTRYLALQEAAEPFGQRLYPFALRLGCERAATVVVLGDGAEWIWNLAECHFSDATMILDFYHASEHVWELGRLVFGAENPEGTAWARACSHRLEAEGVPGLLRSLPALRERRRRLGREVRAAVGRELRYFRKQRERMQYPHYRQAGVMIGSGPVAAACKVVVGQRLKGAGMRWSEGGADAMLAARTVVLAEEEETLVQHARAA